MTSEERKRIQSMGGVSVMVVDLLIAVQVYELSTPGVRRVSGR
jgi:hypothetical protein